MPCLSSYWDSEATSLIGNTLCLRAAGALNSYQNNKVHDIFNLFATEFLGITKFDVSALVTLLTCIKILVSLGCNLNHLFMV